MGVEWKSRTELLLGNECLEKLEKANVLVVGIGGVGGAATEMLVRAGIGNITIIDADTVNESNINRQLNALTGTVGFKKVEVTKSRMKDINPELNITVIDIFLTGENIESFFANTDFNFVVDAIDTIEPKINLISYCINNKIPVVSAMGAGGRINPELIKITDISKTNQCALAKVVRRELKLKGIYKGLPVVFSPEIVNKNAVLPVSGERNKKSTVGTISYMPALFGCHMASYVIRQIIKNDCI